MKRFMIAALLVLVGLVGMVQGQTQNELDRRSWAETIRFTAMYSWSLADCSRQAAETAAVLAEGQRTTAIANNGNSAMIEIGDAKMDLADTDYLASFFDMTAGNNHFFAGDVWYWDAVTAWNNGHYGAAATLYDNARSRFNDAAIDYWDAEDHWDAAKVLYDDAYNYYLYSWYMY